ncbi:MAG: ribosomal large subunit pseudouridine synthase, partial [Pseudomonas orientalis]|nr:ribosomal large subunit pseudouridine synthase [Pseudomonas orientalis]
VFLNSDLPMGRWREMSQYEVDILSAEVGLTPVAMPQMNAKSKDKLERMQRKSSRPVPRTERVARTLRPALNAPATGGRISREPQIEGERRPTAPSRQEGERAPRTPRPAPAGGRSNRGETDRPADNASTKRPAKPSANKRPGPKLVADEPSGKRRGAPAGSGQRPGFGRKKPQ